MVKVREDKRIINVMKLHIILNNLKEKHYGPEHYQLAVTLHNLSLINSELAMSTKALEYAQRSYDLYKKCFGLAHTQTLNTEIWLNNLKGETREDQIKMSRP